MSLTAGIVGLPNVGKSTLFNAITKAGALAANYPFATIEPNVGVVVVPDHRLDVLNDMYKPKSLVATTFEFTDIAGLVKGASKGEGLGNQFLANIRNVDAICQVVRCFENSNITHVEGGINPIRDIEIINLELIFSDLDVVEKRIPKIEHKAKSKVDDAEEEYELLLIKKFEQKNKEGKIITTGFYPIPMPEVRFRKASAQRAIVVDNFDPSRMGRVRVKYPWQSANDENSTPWIRISSPMASKDAGFVFTPDINDEVLIDYEDGNIERPYVCGAFYNESNKPAVVAQTQFPGLVKSITSKHGHHISFTDNAGSERFLASSSKLAKLITSYGVGEETFKGDVLDRYLGGGFEISDYYGVYSIKGCTHNRSLDISSPFGTVSLNAFQGITINAPLGDVKIVGKNVEAW